MPRTPLYHWKTTTAVGEQRPMTLPMLSPGSNEKTRVERLEGSQMTINGVTDGAYVALDLLGQSVGFDAQRAKRQIDEIEGLVHRTFAVPADGAFIIGAPLVRSRLKGVSEKTGSDGFTRREVVRDRESVAKESPRYLIVVGTVQEMSTQELTQLVGARAARMIESNRKDALERTAQLGDNGPPPPPKPGDPPRPPVKVQPDLGTSNWVFDGRALLLGPEPTEHGLYAAARAKRLDKVMKRVREIVADENIPIRELYGQLIITAQRPVLRKVAKLLQDMTAEMLLEAE
jgi:hypothetical protein